MNAKLIVLFLLFYSSSWAQVIVENISDKEYFPNISLKITDRDPTVKTKTDFLVKEGEKSIYFYFQDLGKIEKENEVQNILILVENLHHKDRLQFYKNTLLNSIEQLDTHNFNINIAVFDRVRNDGTQSVFLLLDDYTSDKHKILKAIKNIKPKNDIFGNNKSTDLYLTIYEGLDNLNKSFKTNKTLIVLSTAFNNKWSSHTSTESAKALANKSDIAVYSLQYRIQGYEHHKLTDLVEVNYGNEIITNNEDKAQRFLVNTISQIKNNLGKQYKITYSSTHKENGETYSDSLLINDAIFTITVKTNNKYLLLYYGIAGFLLLLILLAIFFKIRNNKKNQDNEFQVLEEQILEEKTKNKEINRDLILQKEDLTRLKTEKEAKTLEEKNIKEEEEILNKMKLFGNLPILQYTIITDKSKLLSYSITKSATKIGRGTTNEVVLNNPTVSREHAMLYFAENEYWIKDLNSTAGTYVNGDKIQQQELKHGNVIKLGNAELTFIL